MKTRNEILKERMLKAFEKNRADIVVQYMEQGLVLNKEEMRELLLKAKDGQMISALLKNKIEFIDDDDNDITNEVDVDKAVRDIGKEIQEMKKGTTINYDKGILNPMLEDRYKNEVKLNESKTGIDSLFVRFRIRF